MIYVVCQYEFVFEFWFSIVKSGVHSNFSENINTESNES